MLFSILLVPPPLPSHLRHDLSLYSLVCVRIPLVEMAYQRGNSVVVERSEVLLADLKKFVASVWR